MTSVAAWLVAHGDQPRLECELLLGRSLNATRAQLIAHPERLLNSTELEQASHLAQRLRAGEPYAYITGEQEFWSLPLTVTPEVLIPRPETETLVEQALEKLLSGSTRSPGRVLDLGTGSGAVAIAIAHECARQQVGHCVTATDLSAAALAVARANASALQVPVSFAHGAWFDAVSGQFDVVASNPPYVAAGDHHLHKLSHEPHAALVSGADGLNDLRAICSSALDYIVPGGWLLVEHGADQGASVRGLFARGGFEQVETIADIANLERVTLGSRPA